MLQEANLGNSPEGSAALSPGWRLELSPRLRTQGEVGPVPGYVSPVCTGNRDNNVFAAITTSLL